MVAPLETETVVAARVKLAIFKEEFEARVTADRELVDPMLPPAVTAELLVRARVPSPKDEPLIVPETEEPLFRVRVDPVSRTVLPVIDLLAAKVRALEEFSLTVEALIDSLAAMVTELPILTAARPFVEPRRFPEVIVLLAVRLTVPVLAEDPLTDPVNVPDPRFRIELDPMVIAPVRLPKVVVRVEDDPIVTAPVIFPEVVVRVEDDPRVMVVASRLLDPAARVFESARVIALKELEFVPTFPARVLLSVKAAVPTPSVKP